MRTIKVFDTTLRDGEQSPGNSMNAADKLRIAKQLVRMKVDIIEAGFAFASPGDFEAIKTIAGEVEGPVICSLARAEEDDIKRAWEAIKDAPKNRIHTFHSTSAIHLLHQHKGMSQKRALERAVEAVKFAKSFTNDVQFSPMDATRTDRGFLREVVEAVIAAGATTVNIPDTVGYSVPLEFGAMIKELFKKVPNINDAVIAVHCHNDLGLATANSLAAVFNGAGQIECTVNGIGERAGNCSSEEAIMALRTRRDLFEADTGIVTEEIMRASKLIISITGVHVQPNKAIVGANAFAHEAGIHWAGLLKDKSTYEIIRPESVGVRSKFVLGKHSGKSAMNNRLVELGYQLNKEQLKAAFKRFKKLADKIGEISDDNLIIIVEEDIQTVEEHYKLVRLVYGKGKGDSLKPWAEVTIQAGEKILPAKETEGVGSIDALFKAIMAALGTDIEILKNSSESVDGGTETLFEAFVRVQEGKHVVTGNGRNTDSPEASVKAFLNALNKLHAKTVRGCLDYSY